MSTTQRQRGQLQRRAERACWSERMKSVSQRGQRIVGMVIGDEGTQAGGAAGPEIIWR